MRSGDLGRVRSLAGASDGAEALTARVELALLDADIPGALRFAEQAVERALTPETKAPALVARSRALRAAGRGGDGEAALREHLSAQPQAHAVRLELAELLLERGARGEAEVLLKAFGAFYNNSLLKTSDELTILSKAMAHLGSFDDANFAMERAAELEPKNLTALVHWGELLLSKYNTADAETTFGEVLAANPQNIGALLGLAKTELELSNDSSKVLKLLDEVARQAPRSMELALLRSRVAIRDSDCGQAREHADSVLAARPKQLEALTIKAACDYLDDDVAAFEAKVAEITRLNPRYTAVYTTTASYAVNVHRYEEAVKLHRRALAIDADDPEALLGLGIGLSRIGREDEAIDRLRHTFDVDPYNVRAFNMVELYETQMKEYEFTEYDRFRIRAHGTQNEMINALVAPLVSEAMATFDRSYGFQPSREYLAVEIFPNPVTFAVRSVGLPHVSPHGICFGKVVVSRSPSEGNFNWRQVIWHEMAHVYHIQLAKSRVPRWFTEGLAEYETNIVDPAWSRHHDRELARALNAGGLRGVLEMNHGFTHARSFEEVLRSYHQSSLFIHYIAETWGYEVLPKMLRTWGERKRTEEVLASVLGVDAAGFDAGFAKWLGRRYLNFSRQITVDLANLGEVSELEKSEDPRRIARLAIARYRQGNVTGADEAMARAVASGAEDAEVNAIAALYYYDRGRVRDAHLAGIAVLDAGRDSYDLRILLGAASLQLEQVEAALVHYQAAATLWEDGAEAWSGLVKVSQALKHEALEEEARRRLFMLDQNDPRLAQERAQSLGANGDWAGSLAAAERWVAIAPFDARSHHAVVDAAIELKKYATARGAWQQLAVLRPAEAPDILLAGMRTLVQAGARSEAESMRQSALAAGASKSEVERALR